jgi:hypothetical protein
MAHEKKVVRSINAPGDMLCVDIFVRPDGSFGYEEYRRDVEDSSGWFPVSRYSEQQFQTAEAALSAAKGNVGWLDQALPK